MKHRRGPPGATVRYVTIAVRRECDTGRGARAPSGQRLTTMANQMAPMDHNRNVIAIAEMPFTSVTPPNEMSADRSGMRVSVVQTQK